MPSDRVVTSTQAIAKNSDVAKFVLAACCQQIKIDLATTHQYPVHGSSIELIDFIDNALKLAMLNCI